MRAPAKVPSASHADRQIGSDSYRGWRESRRTAKPVPSSPVPTTASKPTSIPVNGSVPLEVVTLHVSGPYVWHSEDPCAKAELGATISANPTSNDVAKRFMSPFQK